jgi:hypothetical protein
MPQATDQQVQVYVNDRVRPFAEKARALYLLSLDNKQAIDDVYDACDPPENATWTDNRTDGPPTLLTPDHVLAFNTWISQFIKVVENDFANDAERIAAVNDLATQWPSLMDACVRAPGV